MDDTQRHAFTEWTANFVMKEHELGQSYTVLLFLGPVPPTATQWRTSPSLVGVYSAHTSGTPRPGEENAEIEGNIALTGALRRSDLTSSNPEDVVPFLRRNLHWRVQKESAALVLKHVHDCNVFCTIGRRRSCEEFAVDFVEDYRPFIPDGPYTISQSYRRHYTASRVYRWVNGGVTC
jgi:hypothetical protein